MVLAGVEYLCPIYREASSYPHLVDEDVPVRPTGMRPDELRGKAWAVVEPLFLKERKIAGDRYGYLLGTGRASAALEAVVPAAFEGRVDVLFVAQGARQWGSYDGEARRIRTENRPGPHNMDLLDFAAVQTLLHGGKVYAVEPDRMPGEGAIVAAVFRY